MKTQKPERFPVLSYLPGSYTVPWSVAEQAYREMYRRHFGEELTQEQCDRALQDHPGFTVGALDGHYGLHWREVAIFEPAELPPVLTQEEVRERIERGRRQSGAARRGR